VKLIPHVSPVAINRISSLPPQPLALTACDIDYALRNINFIRNYSDFASTHQDVPLLLCAIYDSSANDQSFHHKISTLLELIGEFKRVIFFDFTAPDLYLPDYSTASRLILANYIKCARYILVDHIWRLTCADKSDNAHLNSRVYVLDYDFLVRADYHSELKSNYNNAKSILSFCLDSKNEQNFIEDFCHTFVKKNDNNEYLTQIDYSHKIIKAGFSSFSYCISSKIFLLFFQRYSIQRPSDSEPLERRLFNHYYGDQLCMSLALREMKSSCSELLRDFEWINLNHSGLASVKAEVGSALYFPKGNEFG